MSATLHTRFASPATLLTDWAGRGEALEHLLLLGFTVDLPFLEKVAIPVARGLGARVAVIGDAAHGVYDPVDVRLAGRGYLHGLATCGGAFHPKVALLIGEHACRLAVGSGNPTLSGWGANDELWTVVETEDDASHALLADLADWLEELPSVVRLAPWSAEYLGEVAELLTERHINAPAAPDNGVRLLHNLRRGLLGQLPRGPVDTLHLYAPFVDPTGAALRALVDRLAPGHTTLGLQERWSSYDAETVNAALDGHTAEIRLLEEVRTRHGKLVQWRTGDVLHALTGSPNLTQAALCASTADGGNCELAVLATGTAQLFPKEGRFLPPSDLKGRTVRPFTAPGHDLVLLGAKADSAGLHVLLAAAQPAPVRISVSPDGSPGSWQDIGVIEAGTMARSFPSPQAPVAAIRATSARPDGTVAESPVVFIYSPVLCAPSGGADHAPGLRYDYTTDALFTDDRAARRFENDLVRLRELTGTAPRRTLATASGTSQRTASQVDRWDAYLADCRRMIGDELTDLAFGMTSVRLPQAPSSARWTVSEIVATEPDEEYEVHPDTLDKQTDDEDPGTVMTSAVPAVPVAERARCRTWIRRWADALTGEEGSAVPVPARLLVAGLHIQLLAAGVWDADDDSWREVLHDLAAALVRPADRSEDGDAPPPEVERRSKAVVAVAMALLSQDAGFSGGGERDLVAARTWAMCREMIAEAEPDQADDLMIPPDRAHARVTAWSEVEHLVRLAQDDDPYAEAVEELEASGWSVALAEGLWEITGSFGNPVPVAAKAADRLGRAKGHSVLVRARSGDRWAFVAWDNPLLILLNFRVWSTYRINPPATPSSRLTGGDLSAVPGLVGPRAPLKSGAPAPLRQILEDRGLDYPALIGRLFS